MPRASSKIRLLTVIAAMGVVIASGCRLQDRSQEAASARVATETPARFGLGRAATPEEIAAVDLDVNGSGVGLPPGSGDARRGAAVYRTHCASCHGARGEGVPPNPPLVGREPREGFPFADDPALVRTVGNYWPYATTLFDYVRRTMPLNAPGVLTTEELYSVTAFLLAANEVIPEGSPLDAAALRAVRMPARDRFVPDDRRGGAEVR